MRKTIYQMYILFVGQCIEFDEKHKYIHQLIAVLQHKSTCLALILLSMDFASSFFQEFVQEVVPSKQRTYFSTDDDHNNYCIYIPW